MDKSIKLPLLEPSPVPSIARELMVKARRRKGLLDEVNMLSIFEGPELIAHLKTD